MRDEMNNFLAQAFDWGRWPKLAAIFERRPRLNVYWQELADFVTAQPGHVVEVDIATARIATLEARIAELERERDEWYNDFARTRAEVLQLRADIVRVTSDRDVAARLLVRRHGMECPTYDDNTGTCGGCEVSAYLARHPTPDNETT